MGTPDNPSAFPISREAEGWFAPGMTLRDHFAGQIAAAMVGTIRDEDGYDRMRTLAARQGLASVSEWIAREAGKQADAMLAERRPPVSEPIARALTQDPPAPDACSFCSSGLPAIDCPCIPF